MRRGGTAARLVLGALVLGGGLFAQDDLDDLLAAEAELGAETRTVVTAARYSQRVDRTPSNVFIIPRARIDALDPKNVADLLRVVPGFTVFRRGQRGHEVSAFGVGGQFSNKVLVLVDGHRVTEPGFGNVLWHALPVSLEDVERVEVVLGPESTLYGNNAFAAVVNILTGRVQGEDTHRLVLRTGDRGYDHATWLWSGGRDDTRLSVVIEEEHQSGFGALRDGAGNPDPTFRSGEGLRRRMVRVRGETELPEDRRFRFGLSHVDARLSAIPLAPGQRVELDGEEDALALTFDLDRAFSLRSGIEVKGTFMQTTRDYSAAPFAAFGVPGRDFDSRLFELELRWRRDTGPWRFVTGAGTRQIGANGYVMDVGDDDASAHSVFVQGERDFGDRFVLFLGARGVFQDLASDTLSWKVSGLYRPRRDTGIRLSMGTSFRQPDLVAARFRRSRNLNGVATDQPALLPNTTLENEVAKEFLQAGFERQWRKGWGKVDFYTARLENIISLTRTGTMVNLLTPAPVASGVAQQQWRNDPFTHRIRGVTGALEQELGELRLSLGVNFQDVDGVTGASDAPYSPSRSGSLSLSYPARGRRLGATLTWTGVGSYDVDENARSDGAAAQQPGYGLVDLNLEKRVSKRARLGLGVRNLLDKQHREILYTLIGDAREQGVVYGREVWLTLRWDL